MEDLDTHPAGFDSDSATDSPGGSNKLMLVALAVGVVGIVLGVTGIFLATQSANALEAYKAELAEAEDPIAGEFAALQQSVNAKIDDIEGRMGNMGGSIMQLKRQSGGAEVAKQMQDLRDQTQQAFDAVSDEVRANRVQLNETNQRLQELISRGVTRSSSASTASSTPASTPTASSEPQAPLEVPEGATVHTVQPGENMSVIARKYGISLVNLMQANPTVEPKRMMPGDQIVVPAP